MSAGEKIQIFFFYSNWIGAMVRKVKKVLTECGKYEKRVIEKDIEGKVCSRKMFHTSKGTQGMNREVFQRFRSKRQ